MTRGAKPKPTHLKVIEGNPGKRRLNKREPRPDPAIPEAPEGLEGEALEEWGKVAPELYRLGVLSRLDKAVLAAYCHAYARYMAAERILAEMAKRSPQAKALMIQTTNGNWVQNPLVGTANQAAISMVRYAAELGMTPSARSKIEAGPTPPESKFHGLLGG
jgi:P27 family predicted phage terminase small subunit